jgi:hypothetical protein
MNNIELPTLDVDALDFGYEVICACAGLKGEPVDTLAMLSITWEGLIYDVVIGHRGAGLRHISAQHWENEQ